MTVDGQAGQPQQAGRRRRGQEQPSALVHDDEGGAHWVRVARRKDGAQQPPGSTLELTEALIAVFRWPGIRVTVLRHAKVTLIERFALLAAQELGSITAPELAALTGLPEQAVSPLLQRLLRAGALDEVGGGHYAPTLVAEEILEKETVPVIETTPLDFAYFPATDELIVLTAANGTWPRQFLSHRLLPVSHMPVPGEITDSRPSEVISRHLAARTVHGASADIIEAVEQPDEDPIGDLCPVYQAAPVTCRRDAETGQERVELTIRGRAPQGRPREPWIVRNVRLDGVDGLIARWRRLAGLACDSAPLLWAALAGPATALSGDDQQRIGVEPDDDSGSTRFQVSLPEAAARELGHTGMRLTGESADDVGMRLADEEAAVAISLTFIPDDDDDGAAALFATDRAASLLRASPSEDGADHARVIADAARWWGLDPASPLLPTPDQVLDRMWELKYYRAVCALRESDDFPYQ